MLHFKKGIVRRCYILIFLYQSITFVKRNGSIFYVQVQQMTWFHPFELNQAEWQWRIRKTSISILGPWIGWISLSPLGWGRPIRAKPLSYVDVGPRSLCSTASKSFFLLHFRQQETKEDRHYSCKFDVELLDQSSNEEVTQCCIGYNLRRFSCDFSICAWSRDWRTWAGIGSCCFSGALFPPTRTPNFQLYSINSSSHLLVFNLLQNPVLDFVIFTRSFLSVPERIRSKGWLFRICFHCKCYLMCLKFDPIEWARCVAEACKIRCSTSLRFQNHGIYVSQPEISYHSTIELCCGCNSILNRKSILLQGHSLSCWWVLSQCRRTMGTSNLVFFQMLPQRRSTTSSNLFVLDAIIQITFSGYFHWFGDNLIIIIICCCLMFAVYVFLSNVSERVL